MLHWKNILWGLAIAAAVILIALFARGSSEVFIYNNF
jgi:hypothetical protein